VTTVFSVIRPIPSQPLLPHGGAVAIETAMTAMTVAIPDRFNGPPGSANGGYACGLVAAMVEGPAQVVLRRPPPLATLLLLQAVDGAVTLSDRGTTIAIGTSTFLDPHLPAPPTLNVAREASAGCARLDRHPFPTCFVCGPDRAAGDGLRIFPGPLSGSNVLATAWLPGDDLADVHGRVRCEFVWAALDCPTGWAVLGQRPPGEVAILGTLAVRQERHVAAGDEYVIAAWPLKADGRKLYAGATLWSADGRRCAAAQATWIEVSGA
jgi:hypothetical protein